jgi:hypothetical protein
MLKVYVRSLDCYSTSLYTVAVVASSAALETYRFCSAADQIAMARRPRCDREEADGVAPAGGEDEVPASRAKKQKKEKGSKAKACPAAAFGS